MAQVTPEDLERFGMIPELIGRLPVIATLNQLSEDDLARILTEPKDALTKQYQVLFHYDGAKLEFTDERDPRDRPPGQGPRHRGTGPAVDHGKPDARHHVRAARPPGGPDLHHHRAGRPRRGVALRPGGGVNHDTNMIMHEQHVSSRHERDELRDSLMMKVRSDTLAVLGLISLLAAPTRGEEPPARAANQLADQLKRHPAQLSKSPLRRGLYLMDLAKGDVTMIADEPDPGADSCGSPRWSHDGRRILFDVMPEGSFHLLHIKAIERGDDSPKMTDLGPGARPTFSPG